ncbi:Rad4-domain-containing protein [Zopfia rhizophila CBS 207.26]|uniref:Rad4-domain-containing protein n=1 Tax=Zopfia rhizophila CBS 207.26 TaxID=1314779 RepID=A0A6A6DMA0_9PEZI|nr:Rad4-domain-containing protein [Zopfia rhizophila CBS 207.26]
MPPFVSRKRDRSSSPAPGPSKRSRAAPPRHAKESVFQTLDALPMLSRSLSQTKALLEEEDESELTDPGSSDDEFENVITNGAVQPRNLKDKNKVAGHEEDRESGAESEDEEWEDALGSQHPHHRHKDSYGPVPVVSGDLELTLSSSKNLTAFKTTATGKKGPSKIQRQIRTVTHCMHVQFLMFHNLMRNAWVQDKHVQKLLVEDLTTGCWREMDRYWRNAGISDGPKRVVQHDYLRREAEVFGESNNWNEMGKKGVKVYAGPQSKGKIAKADGKGNSGKPKDKGTRSSDRNQRDWGATSDRLEPNTPNLSAGDPILRLLKYLSAFWKSKFKITAPCLRKRGYLSPSTLEAEIAAWRDNPSNADYFSERIENLEAFRDRARKCEGSRDVGQQLFTALLRGLGIEARMIASLQPVGFGWSQCEEGKSKNLDKLKSRSNAAETNKSNTSPNKPKGKSNAVAGTTDTPIDLSDSDGSNLSSAISISSDSSISISPTKKLPKAINRKYDEELPYPTYWTEVISPLTHTPIAVSPLPRSKIAPSSSPDDLLNFYCRGTSADKAKQVFAYLIAFSSDGTAKDVTTRYLPKHQWPGKTKGFRIPVEKIPIHNKRGKVKKWEEWDWFKSVLRPYARDIGNRRVWDEVEDEGDLVSAQPSKPKDMDEEGGKETLQGYKNSAEYVLERHLRREEALKPSAKIIRYFATGKGDKEKKEPVYLRKDIVLCKTVESWHKEGREVRQGEQPLKYVPMRAVTMTRKREIEEREREEGEKVKQGLYSEAQTDWIIPNPIQDGKIPRNAFGNIDVYVPTMIPKGAVHIPLRGTAKICKRLGVDFAAACTGFEFGKQRAVPVLTGVVVAAENEDLVIDAWEADEAEKARKEADKKEKLVLGLWKKFFVGLRIVERMKREYGDDAEQPAPEPAMSAKALEKSEWETFNNHQDFEGGFLREEPGIGELMEGGFVRGEQQEGHATTSHGGGFLAEDHEGTEVDYIPSPDPPGHTGELTIDHGDEEPAPEPKPAENAYQTPMSLHSTLQKPVSDPEPDPEIQVPPPKPNARGRGKACAPRSYKSTRTSRNKALNFADEDMESERSELSESGDDDEEEFTVTRNAKRKAPARGAPKRKAARKSEMAVKSHYFEHGSDEETDLSPVKKGRGRRKTRG